jgi:Leucine-rich repeat (LRR) protein
LFGEDYFVTVVAVNIAASLATDDDLRLLTLLPSVETVRLESVPRITDAGLRHLRKLPLRELRIGVNRYTPGGLTDDCLVHLKGLKKLSVLDLNNNRFTDDGIGHLRNLTKLRTLILEGTEITDKGLEALRGMSELEQLDLSGTNVTDSGMRHLAGLSQLRYLDLSATQVSDKGLQQLKALPNCQVAR